MGELSRPRPAQLQREAWVYVRQSTMTQVRENTESLNRQYELVDRARELGWGPEQVHVVDEDRGRSGAEASARAGFQSLVAAVGLGRVGPGWVGFGQVGRVRSGGARSGQAAPLRSRRRRWSRRRC